MPFISVVICTYGRDLLALRAIRSVLANEYQDYDLIVVGQGQRGALERRLQQELGPCPPLRYVHSETIGLSQARNLGVAHSDAEVVVFLDDDARALPGWLRSYAEAFSGEPQPVMVGGKLVPEWEGRRPSWYPSLRLSQLGLYDIGDRVVPFPEHDLPVGANFGIRRQAVLDVGGFDTELGFKAGQRSSLGGEDSLVARRVKQRGGLILYHPGAAAEHRISREKLRLRSFVRRSFVEGRTQIAILSRASASTASYFRGVMRWHAVALLRAPLNLMRQLRAGRLPGLEPLGELAAAVSLSAGVIFESWLCLRRLPPGEAPVQRERL